MDKKCETLLRLVQRGEFVSFKSEIEALESIQNENSELSLNKICRKSTGDSLLHIAARFGRVDILRYLIEKGCNTEQGNLDGKTALHDAAQFSNFECVNLLLEKGSNVNAVKKADWTPLMLACTKQNLAIVRTLLKFGADPKFCNKDGWNCFHIACREGNIDIVSVIFQSQDLICTPSRNGRRPIHTAVMHGHEKVVDFILEKYNSEVNVQDNCGTTPVMDSCRFGFVEILKVLVTNGADLELRNKIGQNCLHIAAEAGQNLILQTLVTEYSFNVNSLGRSGMTALHYAVKEDQVESVNCLVALGASPELKDDHGRRCADLAICLKKQQILDSNIFEKINI